MNLDNQIPVFILHVLEADVPQDARIVDQDVDSSEILDGCLNDVLAIDHIIVICNGFSTGGSNFLDNDIGGLEERDYKLAWEELRCSLQATSGVGKFPSPLKTGPRL